MFQVNRGVKKQKRISVGVVTLLCFVLMTPLQSDEAWKPLFNGEDFIVVHRRHPKAIRGNVLWLDTGGEKFANLRKREDWSHVQISFKGPRLRVTLNGTKICDVTDNPTDPAEAPWKEAGPISFQWPHGGGVGFAGFVKLRHVRIREL